MAKHKAKAKAMAMVMAMAMSTAMAKAMATDKAIATGSFFNHYLHGVCCTNHACSSSTSNSNIELHI